MSKRKHDEASSASSTTTEQLPIFTSTPIHDRSSTFTAIFTPSTGTPRSHQRHSPFDSAMHKILAWRQPSGQKSLSGSFSTQGGEATKVVYETHSDDDGEKYAGKKLEKVLIEMDVVGTVVVARWYGGVLLGPVRFKWIEDSAREAIGKWKATQGNGENGGQVKKAKVDGNGDVDEVKQKEVLMKALKDRDASVNVLRGLLADKNAELKKLEDEEVSIGEGDGTKQMNEVKSSPAISTIPEYDSMSLERLKQLEKARDATLSWILKQIDAVEEKIKHKRGAEEKS